MVFWGPHRNSLWQKKLCCNLFQVKPYFAWTIHTQCILSCTAGGKQAARGREGARENRRWEGRREQGAGGREEAMM